MAVPVAAAAAAVVVAALSSPAVATAATAAALVPIVYSDLREGRIPTRVVHLAAVPVVTALMIAALLGGDWGRLVTAVLAAAAAAAVFALAWVAGAAGFGDVRLAALVSLTVAWHGVAGVTAMWWWTCVAVFVIAVSARFRHRRTIPLAPAIAFGWVAALMGVA